MGDLTVAGVLLGSFVQFPNLAGRLQQEWRPNFEGDSKGWLSLSSGCHTLAGENTPFQELRGAFCQNTISTRTAQLTELQRDLVPGLLQGGGVQTATPSTQTLHDGPERLRGSSDITQ